MKRIITLILLAITFNAQAADGLFDFLKNKTGPPSSEQLIIFYRNDCPHCENMSKVLEKESGFVKMLQDNFNIRKVDIMSEEGRLLADKFNVHAVPSIVQYDSRTGDNFTVKGFPGISRLAEKLHLNYILPVKQEEGESNLLKTFSQTISENKSGVNNDFAACGDGIVNGGEQCDDGNTTNGDGCSATCTVQFGYSCVGSPSVCSTTCGDGIKAGSEQCDDGNIANGDGCSAFCTVQAGYTCTGSPSVCTITEVCGDGFIQGSETCDDGNTVSGDGCSATCTVQPGFTCTGMPSVCTSTCGDGIVAGSETCDDGNLSNGDGCNATCNVEAGFSCVGSPSVCTGPPVNDNCSGAIAFSGTSGTLAVNNSNATSPGVAIPSCATGAQKDIWYKFTLGSSTLINIKVAHGTLADPAVSVYSGSCASLNQVLCNDDITAFTNLDAYVAGTLAAGTYFVRVQGFSSTGGTMTVIYNLTGAGCGDGIVQSGEECDDGNLNNNDGCSVTCNFENAAGITGVAINKDATRPDPSSLMDVKSTDRGVLIPRMTSTQRTAIAAPAKSLLVFDITTNSFWYFKTGSGWVEIGVVSPGTGFSAFNNTVTPLNSPVTYTPSFTESYDDGNNFASTNFTVPQTGIYQFQATFNVNVISAPAAFSLTANIQIFTPSTVIAANSIVIPAGFTGLLSVSASVNTKLSAGNLIYTNLSKTTAATMNVQSITYSGYRVY